MILYLLQNRFRIDDLEELYDRYFLRIQNSYFNVYLVIQVVLSFVYILILLYFSFAEDDVHREHRCPLNGSVQNKTYVHSDSRCNVSYL